MNDEVNEISKIINKNYKEYTKFHYPLSYQILYVWKNSLGKDLETSIILSSLAIKALKVYNRNNKKYSYKDLLKTKEISIGKIGVLSDHGDVDLFGEFIEAMSHGLPFCEKACIIAINVKNIAESLFFKHQWNVVDVGDVMCREDCFRTNMAEG